MTPPTDNIDPADRKYLAGLEVQKAYQSLHQGNRNQARSHAEQAARFAPELEEPWLVLAALSDPRASITYLKQALRVNPNSTRAQKGMQWARRRQGTKNESTASALAPQNAVPTNTVIYRVQPKAHTATRKLPDIMRFSFGLLFFAVLFIAASMTPYYYRYLSGLGFNLFNQNRDFALAAQEVKFTESATATTAFSTPSQSGEATDHSSDSNPTQIIHPTDTPFQVSSQTPTSTSTPTSQPGDTSLPTETFTPVPTSAPPTLEPTSIPPTPKPTKKPKQASKPGPGPRPIKVTLNDRWVDVDLSSQTTYAMQGDQIIRSFIVSTGKWPTVTIAGVFKIYVKYKHASMSGDDYYLPNVPYVMYFFQDYGLHGTYWHNEFGTPMSHGCINLKTEDAGWLFDFASVGTVVSIHQ